MGAIKMNDDQAAIKMTDEQWKMHLQNLPRIWLTKADEIPIPGAESYRISRYMSLTVCKDHRDYASDTDTDEEWDEEDDGMLDDKVPLKKRNVNETCAAFQVTYTVEVAPTFRQEDELCLSGDCVLLMKITLYSREPNVGYLVGFQHQEDAADDLSARNYRRVGRVTPQQLWNNTMWVADNVLKVPELHFVDGSQLGLDCGDQLNSYKWSVFKFIVREEERPSFYTKLGATTDSTVNRITACHPSFLTKEFKDNELLFNKVQMRIKYLYWKGVKKNHLLSRIELDRLLKRYKAAAEYYCGGCPEMVVPTSSRWKNQAAGPSHTMAVDEVGIIHRGVKRKLAVDEALLLGLDQQGLQEQFRNVFTRNSFGKFIRVAAYVFAWH